MSETGRPLLNPVLRLTKDPKPARISGGGKNRDSIISRRLENQRVALSKKLGELASEAWQRPNFAGNVLIYIEMFEDSLAPSYEPSDLFNKTCGAQMVAPYQSGYLLEITANQFERLASRVRTTDRVAEVVDISRIKAISWFDDAHVTRGKSVEHLWEEAPALETGRGFLIWLMPLKNDAAAEVLLQKVGGFNGEIIASPAPMPFDIRLEEARRLPEPMRRQLQVRATEADLIGRALREYRQIRRARATVIVSSIEALAELVASGSIFRIDPVVPLKTTSPGGGPDPARPLPATIAVQPIVGIIDGGMTARSYDGAQAWAVPPYVPNHVADVPHGNVVTSLIVHGHEWNNNLTLPELHCRFGTVQAVPRAGAGFVTDPQRFIDYLDAAMLGYPETKVWNLSFNQAVDCDSHQVTAFSHDLASLARRHEVLLVISVGNQPGNALQPPADCEAALTVGGRLHDASGNVADKCSVSLSGPGPSGMLKPEVSNFSEVRAVGGGLIRGSSFATALTSPLAAHAMARLRDPSPDLVKALLIHKTDLGAHDNALGFGTPASDTLPWESRPGMVTLQWSASLRPGMAYYWDLPIPPSMRKTGKLRGKGTLTAILNPSPMTTDYAGPNYFSARLSTALQIQRGKNEKGIPKFHNLLGSMGTEKETETSARTIGHKWSPLRHHRNEFASRAFDGDNLRVYARIFTRDLYLYDMTAQEDVPKLNVVFVLSIGTGRDEDDVYSEIRNDLGNYVENAIIETDIDLDLDDLL